MPTRALPLILAILVGVVSILPHALAVFSIGDDYKGYPFLYQANEELYMARVQAVVNGHPLVGALIYEYQDMWPPVAPVPEQLYALPSLLFGAKLETTIVVYKLLLPALLFLLVFSIVRTILKNQRHSLPASLAAGLFVTLGYDLINYQALLPMLRGTLETSILSVWTRPINPISGALFLFSSILIVVKILMKDTRYLFLLGGTTLGLSIGYVFSWGLGVTITSLALLWTLYEKDARRAFQLSGMLLISMVIQFPYWYHAFLSGERTSGLGKTGAIFGHDPMINKFLLAGILVFLLLHFFERFRDGVWKFDKISIITGGFLFACAIAYNQQILTGITVWPYHFVQYTIPLIAIALLILGTRVFSDRLPRLTMAFLFLVGIVSLVVSLTTSATYANSMQDFRSRQEYMSIFVWLEQNAPSECVVLVKEPEENLAIALSGFTHCRSYINSYVPFNVPEERIVHNLLVLLRLYDVHPNDLEAYLKDKPQLVNTYLYDSVEQSLFAGLNEETERNIMRLVPLYTEFYKKDFPSELSRYKLDFLIVERGSPLLNNNIQYEATIGRWDIYQLQ